MFKMIRLQWLTSVRIRSNDAICTLVPVVSATFKRFIYLQVHYRSYADLYKGTLKSTRQFFCPERSRFCV